MDTGMHADPRLARATATKVRRRLRAAAAILLLAGLGQAGTVREVRAQGFFDDDILPPRAIAWRLADRGFTGIGRPRFDGRAYVVEAFGPGGARLRLVVDPEDGAILSRQRLDAPVIAVRPAPAAPGYGWTEEDERRGRMAERLVPPADIPVPESRGAYAPRGAGPLSEPGRREAAPAAANPYGLNPEAGRAAPAPRKVARVAPSPDLRPTEAKPALRDAPTAPRPSAARKPADAKPSDTNAETKPDPKTPEAKPAAPVPTEAKPAKAEPAEAKPVAQDKPAAQEWKDPPESKRTVRVIGGATIVPGTVEKDGAAQ